MRFVGIDYGDRRIGLALSDATGLLARPWKTMVRRGQPAAVAAELAAVIAALGAEEDGLAAVVLGFPRRLNGEEHAQSRAVRALAAQLAPLIAAPLVLQDERLTSREADDRLSRSEKDWRKRKAQLDAAAASVILQDYLDWRDPATSLPQADDPAVQSAAGEHRSAEEPR